MKKIYLTLIAGLTLSCYSYAQNTAWPATGASANVGIGTASPLSKFHLVLNNEFSILQRPSSAALGGHAYMTGSSYSYFTGLRENSADYHIFNYTTLSDNLVIKSATGNVGVASVDPVSFFQVDDGVSKVSLGSAGDLNNDVLQWGTSYLGFNAARYTTGSVVSQNWSVSGDGYNNGGGAIFGSILGDMYFVPIASTGGPSRTLTDADIASRVALKLGRDGILYSKEIVVKTPVFPDYVFRKGYRLPPLAEVKSYIDEHHRLPEMPSEEEVIKNGLKVGELNVLLTKKVEELTLYLIEKEKAQQEQTKINQALETRLKFLESKIK
jgi:hypothetical protein